MSEALAEVCGCPRTYLGSIERGRRDISIAAPKALGFDYWVRHFRRLLQTSRPSDSGVA